MSLRGLLFDLWGTLILDVPERSRPRQERRVQLVRSELGSHGMSLDFDTVDRALLAAMASLTALQDSGRELGRGGRARLFASELAGLGYPQPPAASLEAIEEAITAMPLELAPLLEPHAQGVLQQAKSLGLATALVCNAGLTTAPALRALLESLGLVSYFDALVFSDELGVAKPNPLIFDAALQAVSLAARDCAFVGDSPHNDIHGAQSAGLFAVQIGARARDGIRPQASIETLAGLLPVLRSHGLLGPLPAATNA